MALFSVKILLFKSTIVLSTMENNNCFMKCMSYFIKHGENCISLRDKNSTETILRDKKIN